MSQARSNFLADIGGIRQAAQLDAVTAGAKMPHEMADVIILRRGILITSLIAIENMVRGRITEVLTVLGNWPGQFGDLPSDIREAALLSALGHLERYARMKRRNGDDYESDLIEEINRMSGNKGPTFTFSRFVSGDHTGNLSSESIKSLLKMFQVKDCWTSFDVFCREIGLGIPSLKEIFDEIVRKRHQSAHAPNFVPTASDVVALADNLTALGAAIDAALTSSVYQALARWNDWSTGKCKWRDGIEVFLVDPSKNKFKISRLPSIKTLRVFSSREEVIKYVSGLPYLKCVFIAFRDYNQKTIEWRILKS